MDKRGICPRNHDIKYGNGWFQVDRNHPFQDPELTQKADEYIALGCYGAYRRVGMNNIPIIVVMEREIVSWLWKVK